MSAGGLVLACTWSPSVRRNSDDGQVLMGKVDHLPSIVSALPLLYRLAAVLFVALASSGSNAPGWLLLVLVFVHVFWPVSVFVPVSWRNRASSKDAARAGLYCASGLIIIFVAAFAATRDDSLKGTALVLAAGSVHLALASSSDQCTVRAW